MATREPWWHKGLTSEVSTRIEAGSCQAAQRSQHPHAPRLRKPLLRLQVVASHVAAGGQQQLAQRIVSIGGVEYRSKPPGTPALVPWGYALWERSRREALEVWQWMLRKDTIRQDCFLIGPPGARRRRLALAWCEVLGREVEYLMLSRDTTESDLKQRREISLGTLQWADQPPVRAAKGGRVLILDGLEKAERNVLPTLNNLLENREMSLQDGTFLCAPERFDALELSGAAADAGLVRVHQDFRVIALGLPVPQYPGFPLDPPLRSRFQARHVGSPSLEQQLYDLKTTYPAVPASTIESLITFADAIAQMLVAGSEVPGPRPWPFPEAALAAVCTALASFPAEHPGRLLHRVYPYTMLPVETAKACDEALQALGLQGGLSQPAAYSLEALEASRGAENVAGIAFAVTPEASPAAGEGATMMSVTGGGGVPSHAPPPHIEAIPTHASLLVQALQCVTLGQNVCFLGPSGEGKTVLARWLARMLGYPGTRIHTLHVYKDMTSRDLFQRRSTDERGDTRWEPSPLLTAILSGGLCILDGLQRLRPDTIASLQTLCADYDLELPDGTRLCRRDRFEAACAACGVGPESSRVAIGPDRWLRPVHPSFRLMALAAPPGQKPAEQWLSAEILPNFSWLALPRLSSEERAAVLAARCPSASLPSVLGLAARLQASVPQGGDSSYAGWVLSLRQLIRLARRASKHPGSLASDVKRVALASFMPLQMRAAFESILHQELGDYADDTLQQEGIEAKVQGGVLDIGGTQLAVGVGADPRLIPKTKFFDIPRHILRLREILRDLSLGEHQVLLIGNQGTGKNKLADHLLELLQWEREYIQLHRDTTVSSLTVQATLVDGKVAWEDSPLVQAARHGRALMIDEADKAPLEVVCILKGLVEDGEMTLSDGRRLLRDTPEGLADGKVIPIHPNFRMFLLANRPGFPFQGNDLFRETGDVYAPHIIENPDLESEVQLLRNYAPDVEDNVLRRLSSAFTELRQQVDDGLLTYPYSTRELVNVSRHLQRFPGQSIGEALRDILDFDRHDSHALGTLREVLLRWGIPLDVPGGAAGRFAIGTAEERPLPPPISAETWHLRPAADGAAAEVSEVPLEVRSCTYMIDLRKGLKLEGIQGGRAARFTEEVQRWRLPLGSSKYEAEAAMEAVVLPESSTLCVLTERSVTGGLSIMIQDLAAGQGIATCDRLESSFGLRLPMRQKAPVRLFALGPKVFGLAGERRVYVVSVGDQMQAKELTLPASLGPADSKAPPTQWNTDFAQEGAALTWQPRADTVVILDALRMRARAVKVPGLQVERVWALRPDEFFVAGEQGQLWHIRVSSDSEAEVNVVQVVRSVGRISPLQPVHVVGTKESQAGFAYGTITSDSIFLGSLGKEVTGHGTFAISAWCRPSALAAPLHQALLDDRVAVTAVRPAGAPQDSWLLEVAHLGKLTVKTLEPGRLGAPLAASNPAGQQLWPSEAKVCSLQLHGTHAVLVQANGWVRVIEVSSEALAEQRKVWESMAGRSSEEPLEILVDGKPQEEEEGAGGEQAGDGDGQEGEEEAVDEAEQAGLEAVVAELDEAWKGLREVVASALAEANRGAEVGMHGYDMRVQEALEKGSAKTEHEIRSEVAASALAEASRGALKQLLQRQDLMSAGLRQLLEAGLHGGAAALSGQAQAAAAEHELLQRPMQRQQQRQRESQQGEQAGSGSADAEAVADAAARAAISRALAGAFSGERLADRLEKLAGAAAKAAAEALRAAESSSSSSASAHAAAQARLESAQALGAAASASSSSSRSNATGQSGPPGSSADAAESLQAVGAQLVSMASAEQRLATALQQRGGIAAGTGAVAAGGGAEALASAAGDEERQEVKQAADALLQAAQGVLDGMARGRLLGQQRGRQGRQGRGRGRGRGQGKGRGGRGAGGSGAGGPASGRGGGRGPQLKSDGRGGFSEQQLRGVFAEEEKEVLGKIRQKATAVAKRQATKQVLEDLGTEDYDAALLAVQRQIKELRVVLEQQEAKDREREWVAHQATGELDDQRLVDGVTGEKLIYRKRMEPDRPLGQQQRKPKRLAFVMDVSASMYRFNGEDGRLDRMAQATAMIMESLEGFDHKYHWSIVGHSGNGPEITFVDYGNVPQRRIQRAQILSQMISSSAIAASGDTTVEAIAAAVKKVAAQEADDYLVFVVSDANLGGYGITAEMLKRALTSDPKVTACAIFIAERDAAEMLSTALPAGRGYVCLDVEKLPNILKEVFARAAVGS